LVEGDIVGGVAVGCLEWRLGDLERDLGVESRVLGLEGLGLFEEGKRLGKVVGVVPDHSH